jgi:hypothetical protein
MGWVSRGELSSHRNRVSFCSHRRTPLAMRSSCGASCSPSRGATGWRWTCHRAGTSPLLRPPGGRVDVAGVPREKLVCLLGPSLYNSEAKVVRLGDTEFVLLSPVCLLKPQLQTGA